jgi:hypothetical protein
MKKHWIARGSTGKTEFHTLGAAAYLDFCCSKQPLKDYVQRAPRTNRALWRAFRPMYERLRAAIEKQLGEPVTFSDRFALPGFHIFMGKAIERAAGAPVHFDQQYQYLPWKRRLDPLPPLSFTMPVALPHAGGGLNLWHVTPEDVTRYVACGIEADLDRIKERKFEMFHEYHAGTLALHSGLLLHRIGGVSKVRDDDQRITLQGHGVRVGGKWILHW